MHRTAEPARTRQGGTHVIVANTYDELIAAARTVVDGSSYAKVNGDMLDLTTAFLLVQINDALNDKNRDASRRMFQRILDQAAAMDLPAADARRLAMRRTVDLYWKFTR